MLMGAAAAHGVESAAQAIEPPPAPGPPAGLADSAALRATVFGTPPQDMAPMPSRVPLAEINIALPWARPLPDVFWFDRKLRVWFSAQDKPAPLAILISGTGNDGNTAKLSVLRGALYGAGYHVLTMPSPTFPGFIVSTSSTGVAGDLMQDGQDLYAAMQQIVAHLPRKVRITDIDVLGYSLGGANAAIVKSIDAREGKLKIHRAVMINPPVSLFSSIGRLDKLFASSIGSDGRRRSETSAESRGFARGNAAYFAQQTVLGIFHEGVRALLFEATAQFNRRIADRRQSSRHHRRQLAR